MRSRARSLTAVGAALAATALVAGVPALGRDEGDGAVDPIAELRAEVKRERSRRSRHRRSLRKATGSRIRREIKGIGSLDSGTRLEAVDELVQMGDRVLPYLYDCLTSPNGYQARYAVITLCRMRARASAAPLSDRLQGGRVTEAGRFYTTGALGHIASPDSLDTALDLLGDESAPVRLAAAVAVRRCGARAALPKLLDGMALGGVRGEACRAVLERLRADARAGLRAGGAAPPGGGAGGAGGSAPGVDRKAADAELRAFFESLDAKVELDAPMPELIEIPAKRFVLHTDVPEAEALAIGRDISDFRESLARFLEIKDGDVGATVVKLFAEKKDFDDYGATHDYNFRFFSEYYYSFLLREVVAFDDTDTRLRTRRLRHETVHDFVERSCGTAPPWLHEGLAECLEAATEDGEHGLDPKEPNQEWFSLAETAIASGSVRIEDLIAMEGAIYYGGDQSTHYAVSWALVHALLAGPRGDEGREKFLEIIKALRAGRGPEKAMKVLSGTWSARRLTDLVKQHLAELRHR